MSACAHCNDSGVLDVLRLGDPWSVEWCLHCDREIGIDRGSGIGTLEWRRMLTGWPLAEWRSACRPRVITDLRPLDVSRLSLPDVLRLQGALAERGAAFVYVVRQTIFALAK